MRRRDRRQTWGLFGDFVPVIERDMRLEVAERMLADGTIHTPVDPARRARRGRASGARAPRRSASCSCTATPTRPTSAPPLAAAREVWPNPHIAASHEILPEIREFERTSTAALNAVLQPVVGAYLARAGQPGCGRTASPASS